MKGRVSLGVHPLLPPRWFCDISGWVPALHKSPWGWICLRLTEWLKGFQGLGKESSQIQHFACWSEYQPRREVEGGSCNTARLCLLWYPLCREVECCSCSGALVGSYSPKAAVNINSKILCLSAWTRTAWVSIGAAVVFLSVLKSVFICITYRNSPCSPRHFFLQLNLTKEVFL